MASNINPYAVDGTFPIAGQDNSSQGFRDNFTNIKNNFTFAAAEISDLQSKAIVTSALNGQSISNDMGGTQLKRPQLTAWTQSLIDLGAVSSTAILNFNVANFQKITTAAPINLTFINWPASIGSGALGYGVMRVWIVVTDISHTVTLPSSVNIAVTDIAGYDSTTNTITFDSPGNYIFDFSSIDGGLDYFIVDVTRNRASFRDPMLYFNDGIASTFFIGYGASTLPVALALDSGQDIISALGSMNSVTASTNFTGNIAYTQGDQGPTAGYSVTGIRGNLTTGVITGIKSNDLVGYFNALTFTGTGTSSNAINAVGSIGFYANGTSVTNGLGGNVTIWTTPDGTGSTPFVAQKQVVGFENDQSAKFYGNINVAGNFKTESKIVEGGTYLTSIATTGGSFVANASVSTVIVDSTGSSTIAWANITLPSSPTDRQRIKIVSVAPITNANINAPAGAAIKWVTTTKFSTGNISVALTYMSAVGTWYVS